MAYSARVMAEDRLLSEAMEQRPGVCSEAAESVRLSEIVSALVERAKAEGKLRADAEPSDIPGLICGIGRAVARRPRRRR